MEDSRLISLHDHLSEGMSRRGRRGGLGRVKGTPGTTAVLRTKRFEDQHMPDNRLYRGFVRGGVLGKRRLDRIIEDVLDKQEGKKMPWKALRRECVKQWRIENMADESIARDRTLGTEETESSMPEQSCRREMEEAACDIRILTRSLNALAGIRCSSWQEDTSLTAAVDGLEKAVMTLTVQKRGGNRGGGVSRSVGGAPSRSRERVPSYMDQMRASLRRLKTENQHLKLEVHRLTPKAAAKFSRGRPFPGTSREQSCGPVRASASATGKEKRRLEKYEQLLDDLQDELRDLMKSRSEDSHLITEISELRRELVSRQAFGDGSVRRGGDFEEINDSSQRGFGEIVVTQEQLAELRSRNAALEKELRLAHHQLRKEGRQESYARAATANSLSPAKPSASRRSCPGGSLALAVREREGRIRAGAADKIVWKRVDGRMVPVLKDEGLEPGPLPPREDEAADSATQGGTGRLETMPLGSEQPRETDAPPKELPLLAVKAGSLSQVELDEFLSARFKDMSHGSGDVCGQYSAFSNGIISDYLRYAVESGDRSSVAAVLHSLRHITAERSSSDGQFVAHIQKGLGRGNKRKHKSISWALNLFCVHLDICRIQFLSKSRDDPSLAEACDEEWSAAAELYNSVAVHVEDLHQAVVLGRGDDGKTVQDDPEWQDISPDIPPTPCEFLERFVLPHCLWQIPFVELQRRCLEHLDFDVDDEIMDRLWSRVGSLPDRQLEDRRDIARNRAENSIVEEEKAEGLEEAEAEFADTNPPRKSRKSIEEAVQEEITRRRKSAMEGEAAGRKPGLVQNPPVERGRRMERYNRKPKAPNIEVRQHVPGGSFYDECNAMSTSAIAFLVTETSPFRRLLDVFGSALRLSTLLEKASPVRRPRVLVPATPLTIERRRGEMAESQGWHGAGAFGRVTPTEHNRRLFTPARSASGSRSLFSPGEVPQLPALPLEATMASFDMTTPSPTTRGRRSMLHSRSVCKRSARKLQEPEPMNLAAKVLQSPLATVQEEYHAEAETAPATSPEDLVASGAPSLAPSPGSGPAFEISVDRGNYVLERARAYEDSPQYIGHSATISAPHMHAHALELLEPFIVGGAKKILDVGSGSGYLAVCMARLAGATSKVVGIDATDWKSTQCRWLGGLVDDLERTGVFKQPKTTMAGDRRLKYRKLWWIVTYFLVALEERRNMEIMLQLTRSGLCGPNWDGTLVLETDASETGFGGVLIQTEVTSDRLSLTVTCRTLFFGNKKLPAESYGPLWISSIAGVNFLECVRFLVLLG
ncbi:hypothetical protein FOZ60_013315 [Perkinsus olseni]|uniref:protein-L-isoaspartate(D-aspartate) O-methyltransferase n=1 Tax=Perkinsus olseni TaxID=32597 RepID=A0A7J6PLF4_PEROL|nr:hypothetical protein FOZ60_013315 [Perkinsus olseni]